MCGVEPAQEWLWAPQALACGAHRMDMHALQVRLLALSQSSSL